MMKDFLYNNHFGILFLHRIQELSEYQIQPGQVYFCSQLRTEEVVVTVVTILLCAIMTEMMINMQMLYNDVLDH
jgi:hypothetical protein